MTILILCTGEKITNKNFKNSLKSSGNFPCPIIRVGRSPFIRLYSHQTEGWFPEYSVFIST